MLSYLLRLLHKFVQHCFCEAFSLNWIVKVSARNKREVQENIVTKQKLYKSKFNQIGTKEYPIRVVLGDPYKIFNFSQGFFTDLKVFKEIFK